MAFRPGQSGNIKGRPKGSLNKQTRLLTLLEKRAEDLINKLIDLAMSGDSNAIRLCIERLIPKAQPLPTDMRLTLKNKSFGELKDTILRAALDGHIGISDAEKLTKLINTHNANSTSTQPIPLSITTSDPIEAARIYQQIMMD